MRTRCTAASADETSVITGLAGLAGFVLNRQRCRESSQLITIRIGPAAPVIRLDEIWNSAQVDVPETPWCWIPWLPPTPAADRRRSQMPEYTPREPCR